MAASVKTKDINPFFEAVKEPLRLLVLAVIPFGIAYLGGLPYEWSGIATLILRFIDSYLHQQAPKGEAGGLTRF